MRFRHLVIGIASLAALVLCGCSGVPRGAATIEVPIVPSDISDFKILFAQNCSGCHGPEGKGGAAIALADPVYLAVADDVSGSARGSERNRRDGNACLRAKCWRNAHQQTDRCDRQRYSRALVEAGYFERRKPTPVLFIRAWKSLARIGGVRQLLFFVSWCRGPRRRKGELNRKWVVSCPTKRSRTADDRDRGAS